MNIVPTNLTSELPFPTTANVVLSENPSEVECEVMSLFEQFRNPLLRYVLSFGIPVQDSEEVIQEVFLSLFRHLQLGKSRRNLLGWIFRVAHNLALKQRSANQRSRDKTTFDWTIAERQFDPSPNPEERYRSLKDDTACWPFFMLSRKRSSIVFGCAPRASATGK
jgi:DNA-directed RNA polymerase specialized sigma24 family protein